MATNTETENCPKSTVKRQSQELEALLIEAIDGDEFTPLIKDDFEEIKRRGLERIQKKK